MGKSKKKSNSQMLLGKSEVDSESKTNTNKSYRHLRTIEKFEDGLHVRSCFYVNIFLGVVMVKRLCREGNSDTLG